MLAPARSRLASSALASICLVDGHPYHDPPFAEEMERYHEAALEAHRDHARVDLSMPVPAIAGVPGSNGQGNGQATLPQGLPRRPDVED